MRKPYTIAQKAEAVALADVIGAEAAAEQLRMDRRTVVGWALKAGHRPELVIDEWQRLHDLAVARTTVLVASGKVRIRDLAVIAGIAARNIRKPPADATDPDPADPEPLTTAAVMRFRAYVDSLGDDRDYAIRFLRDSIDDEMTRRDGHEIPSEGSPAEQDALDADAFDHAREWIAAHLHEAPAYFAERDAIEAARRRQRDLAQAWIDDETCDLLIEAERELEATA